LSVVLEGNRVKIYNKRGELVQEREATLEDLKEIIVKELAKELTQQYELEVTIDVKEGKGVGRWRRKQ
jgi:hypothetical protein